MDSPQRNQQICLLLVCAIVMWLSGLYTGLHWPNEMELKPDALHFLMKNATDSVPFFEVTTPSCPSQMAVAWDSGRFGNKFFEYLTARLTAQVMGNEIFITRNFADVYDQYFTGRKTRVVDWNYFNYKCGILESNCTKLPIDYLPELQPVSNETFRCVKFTGT